MSELEDFFKLAGQLKRLKRTGWVKRNVADAESVADHSYRVALMAMTLGHLKRQRGQNLDLEKVACLALLHDLPEAFTGDLDPETKRRFGEQRVEEGEKDAVSRVLLLLPRELQAFYEGLFEEYRTQATMEARFVNQLDRAEMLLQAHEYAKHGEKSYLDEFWRDWRRYITDVDIFQLLASLAPDAASRRQK